MYQLASVYNTEKGDGRGKRYPIPLPIYQPPRLLDELLVYFGFG